MNAVSSDDHRSISSVMDHLLSEHGRLVVLQVLVMRLFRPAVRQERSLPMGLSDHLRRDIGLPPEPEAWDP
jgi:hypothetical protein